jgi:hypothetical protein
MPRRKLVIKAWKWRSTATHGSVVARSFLLCLRVVLGKRGGLVPPSRWRCATISMPRVRAAK